MELSSLITQVIGQTYVQEASLLADAFSQVQEAQRKDFIIQQGMPSRLLVYLQTGICRGYVVDESGKEHTTNFFVQPTFMTDLAAYRLKQPCQLNIHPLSPCLIRTLPLAELYKLADEVPIIHKFFREILEQAYIFQQYRQTSFIIADAETRYLDLIRGRSQVFEAVPQKYIASYLGITPQSLSRIRRDMLNRPD